MTTESLITETLAKLSLSTKEPLVMGEVVELCEGYIKAIKVDEPGTKWLEHVLWPKLRELFLFIEGLDQARVNMRDAQHTTFKENEQLKKDIEKYASERDQSEQKAQGYRQLEIKCASLEGELAAAQQAMRQGDRDIEAYKEELRQTNKRLEDSQGAYKGAAAANKELGDSLKAETALVIENARKYEEQLKRNDDLVYELEALKDSKLYRKGEFSQEYVDEAVRQVANCDVDHADECHKLRSKVRMLHGLVNTLRACNEGYALALDECLDDA